MATNIEVAYAPFRASLLAGGLDEPDAGAWGAELIAAHVARNNDLIADAAEAVLKGDDVAYDNAPAIDETELARYVEHAGGLDGLAMEVGRTSARLRRVYEELGSRRDTVIEVRIRDGGAIVYEGPMPIGEFIELNASRHLGAHYDQINALHAPWLSDAPKEFDSYQLVLLIRGESPPELDEASSDELQSQHLGYFAKMRASGFMMVAGPIVGDDAVAGVSIYTAGSVEEARELAEDDPAVRAGRYRIEVMPWLTAKDALRSSP
jgi:uncharacterized protein